MLRLFLLVFFLFTLVSCNKKEASSDSVAARSDSSSEQEIVALDVEIPTYSKVPHLLLIEKFEKMYPYIKVNTRVFYQDYDEAVQKILRAALTDTLPDVTFQSFNRYRALVERGIALPLDELIAAEKSKNFSKQGFNQSMLAAATFNDKVYGLPFGVSLPVVYYNVDLLEKVGGDRNNLPKTWDELIAFAQKIDALGDDIFSMHVDWATGNWIWQALIFSQGGSMMNAEETEVTFGDQYGRWALEQFYRFRNEAHLPDYTLANAASSFTAGKMGMFVATSAGMKSLQDRTGDKFTLKVGLFPEVKATGTLPPAGHGSILLTKDPQRQQAAWLFMKFWSGREGAKTVVNNTGYMSANLAAANNELKQFYLDNPNYAVALQQLNSMGIWYFFPGENSLKITDVITDGLEEIIRGTSNDVDAVLKDMVEKTNELLN